MKTQEVRTVVEPTKENVEAVFASIQKYASEKGYQIKGELKLPTNLLGMTKAIKFESKSHMKVIRNYVTTLNKGVRMGRANRFLHALFKGVYGLEHAPRIEYSDKELEIRAARKAWKKADTEAQLLLKKYKEIKGTFYKK